MPNLFAMSFEGTLAPSFDLRCLHPGHKAPDGWGIGYYPGGEPSASVLKEPAPASGSIRSELVKAWDHLASSVFIVHIRTATWGQNSDANTQPFARAHGGREWLIGHSGSLRERLVLNGGRFEPVGSTDTELVFCDLLERIAEAGWRSIGECDLERLHSELGDLNQHGGMTLAISDGQDLLVYADAHDEGGLHFCQLLPPHEKSLAIGDDDLAINLTSRGELCRKGVLVSSTPLTRSDERPMEWTQVPPGHLLVIRQGAVIQELGAEQRAGRAKVRKLRAVQMAPRQGEPKTLRVVHRTVYHYDHAVERSSHTLKLFPVHDRTQRLLEHTLVLTLDGEPFAGKAIDFDDVFGNRARRFLVERPYRQLTLEATSKVRVEAPPLDFRPLDARRVMPLVWMPWQREMMAPYLLPTELPETQLQELADYAMAFVERNDYDIIGTVLDINRSIYKEYKYIQGATTIATTPFDVYVNRRGVCQDFTNLFICLARLLSIPARYVCGYLYTGPKAENTAQSEASHAWVEVYLPELGWKGFDPTNGVLTQSDHIRVAFGRSYQDATPTSGTLYVGGGLETLTVDVKVDVA
jgi:transglutaminase-like putative cysteine protease/predicted glutamine amidotransferase